MHLQHDHTPKCVKLVLSAYSPGSQAANAPSSKQNCEKNFFRALVAAVPDDIIACGAFPSGDASGSGGAGNSRRRERLGSVPLLASLFTPRATPLCLLVRVVSVFVGCVQKLCHVFSRFCFFLLATFFYAETCPPIHFLPPPPLPDQPVNFSW